MWRGSRGKPNIASVTRFFRGPGRFCVCGRAESEGALTVLLGFGKIFLPAVVTRYWVVGRRPLMDPENAIRREAPKIAEAVRATGGRAGKEAELRKAMARIISVGDFRN